MIDWAGIGYSSGEFQASDGTGSPSDAMMQLDLGRMGIFSESAGQFVGAGVGGWGIAGSR